MHAQETLQFMLEFVFYSAVCGALLKLLGVGGSGENSYTLWEGEGEGGNWRAVLSDAYRGMSKEIGRYGQEASLVSGKH